MHYFYYGGVLNILCVMYTSTMIFIYFFILGPSLLRALGGCTSCLAYGPALLGINTEVDSMRLVYLVLIEMYSTLTIWRRTKVRKHLKARRREGKVIERVLMTRGREGRMIRGLIPGSWVLPAMMSQVTATKEEIALLCSWDYRQGTPMEHGPTPFHGDVAGSGY